jgi:putative Mg2+ transporter-C (MgtC) family protein
MMLDDFINPLIQLSAATVAGMAIGLNRDLHGKPTGVRTLGLVGLASALVTIASLNALSRVAPLDGHIDAVSHVVQGLIQGIMTGIGFIGAGVILRDTSSFKIKGLTTAAAVWVTAALGIVCGLAEWAVLIPSLALVFALLMLGGPLERWAERQIKLGGQDSGADGAP